jgi:hypothetical protein
MTSTAVVDSYLAMWNEPDADARAAAIADLWSDEALYVDPMFEANGHDELAKMVATGQEMFPGHTFTRTGTIDEHHNRLRWSWELAQPGQPAVAGGTDIATVAPSGKILEVIGFIDFAPAH